MDPSRNTSPKPFPSSSSSPQGHDQSARNMPASSPSTLHPYNYNIPSFSPYYSSVMPLSSMFQPYMGDSWSVERLFANYLSSGYPAARPRSYPSYQYVPPTPPFQPPQEYCSRPYASSAPAD